MTSVLSYLTIDGKEVSNSARFYALFLAGLLPQDIDVKSPSCGVLAREAVSGAPCAAFGYSDELAETQILGGNSTPQYISGQGLNNQSRITPQAGVGNPSDGFMVGQDTNFVYAWAPAQGDSWLDGVSVVAFEPQPANLAIGGTVGAYGRGSGSIGQLNGVQVVGDFWVGAEVTFGSSTTASLRLRAYSLQSSSPAFTPVTLGVATTAVNVPAGRQWVLLRMAGAVLTAEWWTQDPRFGGRCYQQVSYTLTTAALGGAGSGITEIGALGSKGRQGVAAGQGSAFPANPPATVLANWFATPTCVPTCNLYPSPFLFPGFYPGQCGSSGQILATTPWTDTSRPESNEFRGLIIDDLEGLDGQTTRSVDQRIGGLGGAALGPLVQQGRPLKFHGWLVATSCRGLDYGREWLNDILASTCHPCPDSVLRIRTAVPSPDDGSVDTQGLYLIYDAGLTDGPHVDALEGSDCTLAEVDFTITAGNGFKYQASQPLLAVTTLASANGSVSAQVPTPPGLGTNGAIVTIKAGSADLLNVYPAQQLATYPADNLYPSDCFFPNDGGSPVTLPIGTCASGFVIPRIPAGGTLVIDSSRHRITFTDASGTVSDGTYLLSQDTARAINWLEADACNPGNGDVVLVGATSYAADATVQIDYAHRER